MATTHSKLARPFSLLPRGRALLFIIDQAVSEASRVAALEWVSVPLGQVGTSEWSLPIDRTTTAIVTVAAAAIPSTRRSGGSFSIFLRLLIAISFETFSIFFA